MPLNKKIYYSLILSIFLIINIFSNNVISDDNEINDLSICIPNSEELTEYSKTVWIRGVWHYFNLSLNEEVDQILIIFFHDLNPPNSYNRDETNYYKWEYNQENWIDIQHNYRYIQEEYCYHESDFYSFYIGIDQYAKNGNWTLEISSNDKILSSRHIYVGKAVTSISLKSIPLTIQAEPFTDGYYRSIGKFTVENEGNMPLELTVDYGKYRDIFSTINLDGIFKTNQIGKYTVLLHSRSTWPPGILKIESSEISLKGEALYIIPPKKTVNIIESSVAAGLPIDIYIGHLDYEIESLAGDITFQYIKNIDIRHGEKKTIYTYVSGNGEVTIDITAKNLRILKIMSNGVEQNTPFKLITTNTSEYPISITVISNEPNSTAYLYYDLEAGGEHKTFRTTIDVGSPLPTKKTYPDLFIYQIFIISCIIILVAYLILNQIKHRR